MDDAPELGERWRRHPAPFIARVAYEEAHYAIHDWLRGIRMADNDTSELGRVFAPMLSELEDHATRLTARQAELARELAGVDAELRKVEAVRAAMAGKRGPGRPKKGDSGYPTTRAGGGYVAPKARERAAKLLAYARERGGEFTGREAADALGLTWQGIGPTLAGMARRGELTVRDDPDAHGRVYALASDD